MAPLSAASCSFAAGTPSTAAFSFGQSQRLHEALHSAREIGWTKNLHILPTPAPPPSWGPSPASVASRGPSCSCTSGAGRVIGNGRSSASALAASALRFLSGKRKAQRQADCARNNQNLECLHFGPFNLRKFQA